VRAKVRIRDERIPYQVPPQDELPERLEGVLRVIYLVFNEGYSASAGDSLTRPDLSGEAIRLGRLLVALMPEPEALGLLALMLLQDSRREARITPGGDLISLEEQDRSLWDGRQIAEGTVLVRRALSQDQFGLIPSRRRSPRCTRRPRASPRRTGLRSSASTTCCCGWSLLPWSS
jgi:RNA polymerase sigma-70 factor, ECF subfamily